jgi:hypothetical protein
VKKLNVRKVTNKDDWTSAFIRYMAVYCDKNPTKTVALLRYFDTVRLAADKFGGLGWRAYDEQFRLLVAENPDKNWSHIDSHLWLLCMTPSAESIQKIPTSAYAGNPQIGITKPPFQQNRRNNQPNKSLVVLAKQGLIARGIRMEGRTGGKFCKYYNYGNCSNQDCIFPHVCRKCGGDHTVAQCKKQ